MAGPSEIKKNYLSVLKNILTREEKLNFASSSGHVMFHL